MSRRENSNQLPVAPLLATKKLPLGAQVVWTFAFAAFWALMAYLTWRWFVVLTVVFGMYGIYLSICYVQRRHATRMKE